MKKFRILKWVAGILVTYGLIGFLGVPYALKNIVPQKVSEATKGGILSLKSASFNPFSFYLQLDDVTFKTPQKGDFIYVNHFVLNLNPLDYLWKFGWVIQEIHIEKPQITLDKNGNGEMNFGWLSTLGGDDNISKEESKPLALLMKNFTLKEGLIDYRDRSEGRHFRQEIHSLGFHLENIDLREASSTKGLMRLYATINDGGFMDVRGKIEDTKPFAITGSVAFNSGKLYTTWRYFEEQLPIEIADGIASFGMKFALNTDDINATKLTGVHAQLNRLRVIPKGQKAKLLDVESLNLSGATVWPIRKVLQVNSVKLNGLAVNATRNKAGVIDWIDYLDQIKKAFPEDENETKIPWKVAVKDIVMENIAVGWRDEAPSQPYMASLSGINVYSQNLSSDPKNSLNATVHLGVLELKRLQETNAFGGFNSVDVSSVMLEREAKRALVKNVVIEGGVMSRSNGSKTEQSICKN